MERLKTELIQRAKDNAPALTPEQFYTGSTGMLLVKAPIPYTTESRFDLHVAARHPAGMPRREGLTGHRLGARDPAPWRVEGLPIEHPARMWRQAADEWSVDDLIIAGDNLVLPKRQLLTIDDLHAEIAALRRGNAKLLKAVEEIRVGAESSEESTLRLVLVRAGLPRPELNWDLRAANGRFIARLDICWPRHRVASEYDGRVHAEDDKQFARDADRWDEVRHVNWDLVRILSHHVRPDPQVAVDKVARALYSAGWRPGRD
ncbi:hypothetical protein OED01_06365 [Microbacterium sp. M28]|uniref:hypothetical protein n=1 Tax=Microbacterium sp. M28 TaxID=2962064 RepID=UPI0021F4100B|nr:hypothetical protein [Microbacterium sp. M28]UYO98330.1 hypothetical protein OED01_06365 [Microbacterium sp. M28]